MGLLDRFRGGGDEEEESRGRLPVDEVRRLGSQGYSESEITETLRDRGYSYSEINEAVNEAVQQRTTESRESQNRRTGSEDVTGSGDMEPSNPQLEEPVPQEPAQSPQSSREPDLSTDVYEEELQEEMAPEPDSGTEDDEESDFGESPGVSMEEEELIEIIVSEHFTEVEDEFSNVYSEIDDLLERVEKLEEEIKEIKIREDEDQEEVVQKVEEMEEYLEQSQSRIGGMEKAFKQVLPSLVENTRELSSLVKDMKEEDV